MFTVRLTVGAPWHSRQAPRWDDTADMRTETTPRGSAECQLGGRLEQRVSVRMSLKTLNVWDKYLLCTFKFFLALLVVGYHKSLTWKKHHSNVKQASPYQQNWRHINWSTITQLSQSFIAYIYLTSVHISNIYEHKSKICACVFSKYINKLNFMQLIFKYELNLQDQKPKA